jgi:hypothetical protein
VGPEKSQASAEYPEKLCREYAILAVSQLKLMGKEEFLKSRMESLQDKIEKTKAAVVDHDVLSSHIPQPPSPPRRRSRTPIRRTTKPSREVKVRASPSSSWPEAGSMKRRVRGRKRGDQDEASNVKGPDNKKVKLEPSLSTGIWKEGEGKYGTLKADKAKKAASQQMDYLGGMRDPFKVVLQMANLQSLGIRVRAAWQRFEREVANTGAVAESYGTKDCTLDPKLVEEWRSRLKQVLGARAPKTVRVKAKWIYTSPLQAEIFRAWISKGNDPEVHVRRWIEDGTPLGIEVPIEVAGIFPLNTEEPNLDFCGGA